MRYHSIDLLRTIAIFLMMLVHLLENLGGVTWSPAGFGAPLFGFLVGVSYRLWLDGQIAKQRPDEEIARSTWRRGVFLIVVGFAFNVVVWLPADTFNWDVLTLIGSAMLVLGVVRDLPLVVPGLMGVAIYAMSPILRSLSGYDQYWLEGYYDPDWTFTQLALGYLLNGYFPIFPWLLFPLLGFVVCRFVFPVEPGGDSGTRWVLLAGVGCVLLGLGLRVTRGAGPDVQRYFGGWTMFPASMEYVTTLTGLVLLWLALARWWVDDRQGLARWPRALAFTRTMSQFSLSVYVLHHLLHLWPVWIYGLATGHKATDYWRKAMSWEMSAALVIPCMFVCYVIVRWLCEKKGYSLEALMRRVSQ